VTISSSGAVLLVDLSNLCRDERLLSAGAQADLRALDNLRDAITRSEDVEIRRLHCVADRSLLTMLPGSNAATFAASSRRVPRSSAPSPMNDSCRSRSMIRRVRRHSSLRWTTSMTFGGPIRASKDQRAIRGLGPGSVRDARRLSQGHGCSRSSAPLAKGGERGTQGAAIAPGQRGETSSRDLLHMWHH